MVLSDLVDVIGGGTPKTTEESYWNGSIPWLSVKDFCGDKKYVYNTEKSITVEGLNNSSTKLLHKDNIIISARGTVGELAMIPYDMAFNQSCFGLIPKGNNDPHFVYYLLKDKVRSLKSQTQGSVFDTITKATFDRIECADYSEEDQRRIASILSSLDRKIELNNKINADLEEMAQAIFKNWFVDFEPFKDGKFVDSELGMIPEGWEVGSLGDFCNVFTGKKNTNQAIEKGLYPFFSCAPEPLASNDAIFNGKAIIIAGNGSYTGRTSFYNGGFDLYQRTYACTIREQDKENLMIFFYHMMKQFFEPVKMGGTRGSSIPYIVMGDITQQKFRGCNLNCVKACS